jgi:ribose 1,5-bisphosphokinase
MGASGSGKDSLLAYARERLAGAPVAFARRYVTRPAQAGGEDHIPVDRAGFAELLAAGRLALSWEANGLCYGVGAEIDAHQAAGRLVVVNGSRGAYGAARERYPGLLAVLIRVEEAILRERLAARGREDAAGVAARLERGRQLEGDLPGVVAIANNGALAAAGERFVAVLRRELAGIAPRPLRGSPGQEPIRTGGRFLPSAD